MLFHLLSLIFIHKFYVLGALNTLLVVPSFNIMKKIKKEKEYITSLKLKKCLKESFWLSLGCSAFGFLGMALNSNLPMLAIFLFLISVLFFIGATHKIIKIL